MVKNVYNLSSLAARFCRAKPASTAIQTFTSAQLPIPLFALNKQPKFNMRPNVSILLASAVIGAKVAVADWGSHNFPVITRCCGVSCSSTMPIFDEAELLGWLSIINRFPCIIQPRCP